ncbi:NAAT family transporter [Candidatus Woesearchaeota archaeon]|nr:NAAT family transporter [Candidatus Woesearchaeota archaeon]
MIDEFLKAFFAIFVIMDVLGNIPIFWSLTKKLSREKKIISVNKALTIASVMLIVFLFLGKNLLDFFGISIDSFRIAGGIIILIVGLEMVLGLRIRERRVEKYEFAIVPLATPLITGPGVITTVILLVDTVGILITLIASILNLFITWVALRYSDHLYKFLGRQGADFLSRVMGLILASLAVEFITTGWKAML